MKQTRNGRKIEKVRERDGEKIREKKKTLIDLPPLVKVGGVRSQKITCKSLSLRIDLREHLLLELSRF